MVRTARKQMLEASFSSKERYSACLQTTYTALHAYGADDERFVSRNVGRE